MPAAGLPTHIHSVWVAAIAGNLAQHPAHAVVDISHHVQCGALLIQEAKRQSELSQMGLHANAGAGGVQKLRQLH